MSKVYEMACDFKKRYPLTITWNRLNKHAKVIDYHLDSDEEIIYAFAGQINHRAFDFFQTGVITITTKRIIIGQKRITPGYFLSSITPDLYNDLKVVSNIIWGTIIIDTVKEKVFISNLDKKALDEVETAISTFMIKKKKEYYQKTK